jgi:hypothetical protein
VPTTSPHSVLPGALTIATSSLPMPRRGTPGPYRHRRRDRPRGRRVIALRTDRQRLDRLQVLLADPMGQPQSGCSTDDRARRSRAPCDAAPRAGQPGRSPAMVTRTSRSTARVV